MKVAIIGHREFAVSEETKEMTKKQIALLVEEGADTFFFAFKGRFNELCYDIVTDMKSEHDLKRVYLRAEF